MGPDFPEKILIEVSAVGFIEGFDLRGIEFPSDEDDAVDRKTRIECGMGHTIALMPLVFLKAEFAEGATRRCPTVRNISPICRVRDHTH